jgi:hypothetical protein
MFDIYLFTKLLCWLVMSIAAICLFAKLWLFCYYLTMRGQIELYRKGITLNDIDFKFTKWFVIFIIPIFVLLSMK